MKKILANVVTLALMVSLLCDAVEQRPRRQYQSDARCGGNDGNCRVRGSL